MPKGIIYLIMSLENILKLHKFMFSKFLSLIRSNPQNGRNSVVFPLQN